MMDAGPDPRVDEEADRWFARLLAPDCTPEEREAFERWRRVPEHAGAYAERESLWRHLGARNVAMDPRIAGLRERVMSRTAPVATGENAGSALEQALEGWRPCTRPRTARRRGAWPAMAAAVLCLVAAGAGLRFVLRSPPETLYVATDALREIALEDGTRLRLDVDTQVAVRYGRRERAVALRQGRVLFDVARAPERPFTVDLGDSRITVLGTRFQASRAPDRVSVTLDSGSLRLDAAAAAGGARSERLVPGDQIRYAPQAPSAWERRRVDSETAAAWVRGRLIFRDTPLAEAVREVNRYAHPRLHLADPGLAGLPVSGNFIAGDSALVAETWAATLPLRSEPGDGEIVLRARRDLHSTAIEQ